MEQLSFQALGTAWSILIDGAPFRTKDQEDLVEYVAHFEKRFSRFLPESEVNQFRDAKEGSYEISEELSKMLQTADVLRSLTKGAFDPAVALLLEQSGYDAQYRFTPETEKIETHQMPTWSLQGTILSLTTGTVFDLGGIGKGYCIDLVAQFLKERGYQYFLIEAGGDMYGTSKADGSEFRVALEWPGKPGVAFGTVQLKDAGLAVSDSFRRRWPAPAAPAEADETASVPSGKGSKDWHHIIDPRTKEPVQKVIGCSALASTAFDADCITSGLFLSAESEYSKIANEFSGEFVVFTDEGGVKISKNWPGEFFE